MSAWSYVSIRSSLSLNSRELTLQCLCMWPQGLCFIQPITFQCHCLIPFVDILKEHREDIADETGYYIVGIENDEFSIPPNTRLNAIMIPISFLLLLIVILVAIACWYWK